MFFDWEVFFKKFPKTVIIWAVSGQIWYGRKKIKKFLDLVIKSTVAVPIWSRKGNFFFQSFFEN